jgi:hypothetical protein
LMEDRAKYDSQGDHERNFRWFLGLTGLPVQ